MDATYDSLPEALHGGEAARKSTSSAAEMLRRRSGPNWGLALEATAAVWRFNSANAARGVRGRCQFRRDEADGSSGRHRGARRAVRDRGLVLAASSAAAASSSSSRHGVDDEGGACRRGQTAGGGALGITWWRAVQTGS
ncbi:hypothetical protein J1614_000613 [Plenodomus biglobosus]|nr:hypothetical protein J1614_000613 [Plenodomus biglobosus]